MKQSEKKSPDDRTQGKERKRKRDKDGESVVSLHTNMQIAIRYQTIEKLNISLWHATLLVFLETCLVDQDFKIWKWTKCYNFLFVPCLSWYTPSPSPSLPSSLPPCITFFSYHLSPSFPSFPLFSILQMNPINASIFMSILSHCFFPFRF